MSLLNNRYSILSTINEGSFGVVSLAKDIMNKDALVAVKCIHKPAKPTDIDEAKEEIAIHQRLGNSHPYIASLLDHFETEDDTYLVMDYYGRGDLYDALRNNTFDMDTTEFLFQLIAAVHFAHSKGVYHRDIKPENILLADDGTLKLADWGLATTIRDNTEFGVGSQRYMAPELFDMNLDSYDAEKADIWSIGICLINVLFARNPFEKATYSDKLFMDFAACREALYDIFPTLSSDGFNVMRHALAINPENRSLDNMVDELYNVESWIFDDYYEDEYEEKPLARMEDKPMEQTELSGWDRTLHFTPRTEESYLKPFALDSNFDDDEDDDEDAEEDEYDTFDDNDDDIFAFDSALDDREAADSLVRSIQSLSLSKHQQPNDYMFMTPQPAM
ncbi:hypothetical protein DV495_001484 [Geotrichum candidum]|uniref:non-specific serine/threonine protein kinase n=1 Tax=Geotrichum candidum TaxID=1173061 RepID=A0A0J9X2J6_GEOCN|nr:hypothetical protein DV454_003319 [Geotrichum candidum]KAI9213842.1 hypothetical protein DS838_001271 [Geotrichum bryndzae]KAF5120816.1 hypothetical protein DV452_001039 [Geotrichum candidum]KAF5132284.1 hypothetical protein DV495_001484 [Geotrichum candidum]KAF7500378.1 hypothetical protein DV113_001575 [Geotrichum candidum]